jgi:hypothetical protein
MAPVAIGILAVWMLKRRRVSLFHLGHREECRLARDREFRRLMKYCEKRTRRKSRSETLLEFAREVESQNPEEFPGLTNVTGLYYRVRFAATVCEGNERRRLRTLCRAVRQASKSLS